MEERLEPESKFIETPEIRLHYLEWPGSGPPAVLLHGRGLCAQVWRPTAESLASRFRVVAMDLRGHGDSDKPGSYNWEDVAPDLKGFVEETGPARHTAHRPLEGGGAGGAGWLLHQR